MEANLLDSAFGNYGKGVWTLEQLWDFDKEGLGRVTVQYARTGPEDSSARLVLLDDESGQEMAVYLTDFPSRWWAPTSSEEARTIMELVAQALIDRMVVVLDKLS